MAAIVLSSCSTGDKSAQRLSQLEDLLQERHSVRQYSDKEVSEDILLDLLWAANGINREDGRRTAPSAVNAQDIELYLCKGDGTYHYLPKDKKLEKISENDIRPIIVAQNDFILNRPVVLLMSDQSKFGRFGARSEIFGAMDAGYVSQNICLYCVAAGLATVPCAPPIDAYKVQSALGLTGEMLPLIYHPIGYPME